MRIRLITLAVAALPILAGCGGDKADQPQITVADVSKSLQDKGIKDRDLADCAAKVYVDEGISQDGLRTLIGSEYDNKPVDPETLGMSKDDADRARSATRKIVGACVGKS
ncbi:hypothetical protein [Nocardia arizonensis]|uniref:hypothetical protein n=1 Tax=Nocardia arizonensis TaxID=1141647 RepID=UPI0006D064F7|nr:hypothetical protein [Nocardia arizonensis]